MMNTDYIPTSPLAPYAISEAAMDKLVARGLVKRAKYQEPIADFAKEKRCQQVAESTARMRERQRQENEAARDALNDSARETLDKQNRGGDQ